MRKHRRLLIVAALLRIWLSQSSGRVCVHNDERRPPPPKGAIRPSSLCFILPHMREPKFSSIVRSHDPVFSC